MKALPQDRRLHHYVDELLAYVLRSVLEWANCSASLLSLGSRATA